MGTDQRKAEAFLREFVERLAEKHGRDLDFVLLFGSTARGEFVLGRSDVDLAIQVKSNEKVKPVESFAEKLFWELDKKHGLKQKEVCSTGKSKSLAENFVKGLEKQTRLYKPFEVFGPKDIDWEKGMVKRIDLMPGAILVASQLTLLYKMKHEGRILYGRDIRREIRPRFTLWEKLKSVWVPQSIAFASVFLALFLPKKAVGYAVKSVFYELESASIVLQNRVPEREKQLKGFENATVYRQRFLDRLRFFVELKLGLLAKQKRGFVEKAIAMKKAGFKGSRLSALKFCWQAFWVIYSTNTAIVLKAVFGKI
jgi:predicted nucleotidyltransferase